jgi:hypothetical protein
MSEAQEAAPVVQSSEQPSGDSGSTAAPTPDSGVEAAPQEPALESSQPDHRLDELLTAEIEEPIFSSGENYKGMNYQEVVRELPDDAKKIIANLRSSYTRKTQELAEQQKIMQQHVEEIQANRSALFNSEFNKNIEETAAADKKDVDPFNPKTIEERIQQEVAKRMQDMLKPMKQAHQLQQQRIKLDAFKRDHPDLDGMKKEVAKVLMDHKGMNLEQAYWVIKGKKLDEQTRQQEDELGKYKAAARSAGLKVGGANRGTNRGVPQYVLDKDDPIAIYRWLEANKGKGKI